MLNVLTTIFRARTSRMIDDLHDQNALLILEQQIRDAAQAVQASRRALAITTAQDAGERQRLEDLKARIADLETRAVAALRDKADHLAATAAEAIAELEIERLAVERDCARFSAENERLKAAGKSASRRLAELERGRRTAEAAEAVRRLRASSVDFAAGPSPLRQAEATLERLRKAQQEAEIAERVFEDLAPDHGAEAIRGKLEAAGYGDTTRPTAASVLERLRQASFAADRASG